VSRGSTDILISGAGISGCVLALMLAEAGFKVTVVEAAAPPPATDELDLRVVALSPSSLGSVVDVGVWPLQAGKAQVYERMVVTGSVSDASLEFNATDIGRRDLGAIVEMRALHAALFDRLHDRVSVRVPARARTLRQRGQRVHVTLDDGGAVDASLLVIAEGEFSTLRDQLGVTTRGRDYESSGIVCALRNERAHDGMAFQRFGPGGPLAFLPLADGRVSMVWTRPQHEVADLLALPDDAFAAELERASGREFGAVIDVGPRRAFPLRLALADSVIAERAVLLGDAAHRVHPLAGLGLNLGLQDAAALVDVLVGARSRGRDIGGIGTLKRYQAWRQSDAEMTAALIDAIERGFRGGATSALPGLLQRGLGLLNDVAPLKQLLVRAACGQLGRLPGNRPS